MMALAQQQRPSKFATPAHHRDARAPREPLVACDVDGSGAASFLEKVIASSALAPAVGALIIPEMEVTELISVLVAVKSAAMALFFLLLSSLSNLLPVKVTSFIYRTKGTSSMPTCTAPYFPM